MKTNPVRSFGACFLLSLAVAGWPPFIHAQTTAGKSLVGEWEGHVVEGDGSNQGQRRMNITLTITDKKITATGGQGQPMGDGTYRTSGRQIDATGTSRQYQGKTYPGIYSVEGDTLKWCSCNERSRTRPTALRTSTKDGHFLMVLTRKK